MADLDITAERHRPSVKEIAFGLVGLDIDAPWDVWLTTPDGHRHRLGTAPDAYEATAKRDRARRDLDQLGLDLFAQQWDVPIDVVRPWL